MKTVLITGATGSVGMATAHNFAARGESVILLARNKAKLEALKKKLFDETGNTKLDYVIADYSSMTSVKKAADEIRTKCNSIDVLINTASVYKRKREESADKLEMMFTVNHLAPFILTNELLDLLKKSSLARIITLTAPSTSKIKFDDLQAQKEYSSFNRFGASKMMNLLFTYALAQRIEGSNVSALAFFPGLVKSDLTNEMPRFLRSIVRLFSRDGSKAANALTKLALDSYPEKLNGKFFKFNGKEIKSSEYSYNRKVQEKLWEISASVSKTSPSHPKQVQTEMITF